MPFYPEWVVLLDDAAKGTSDTSLSPRVAAQIIGAIELLTAERDRLRSKVEELEHEAGIERRHAQGTGMFSR